MTMKKEFYSNGKLLITGEYVVLDGATALALPTKFGQNLLVLDDDNSEIKWTSYDADGSIWFEDTIAFSSIINKDVFENSKNIKNTLIEILHEAYKLNSDFITQSKGYKITTALTFPKNWGLGTSSTLLNNIAQWLQIDAYQLLKNSFGGSGYDVVCAQNNEPILYQLINDKPVVEKIIFNSHFKSNLYFVYLNKKQNSRSAIASYRENSSTIFETIIKINSLTNTILTTSSFVKFCNSVENHEIEMSKILKIEPVKNVLFSDFNGSIKSLGAWGGDFVMAVSQENPTDYFITKGCKIVIPFNEMILQTV